VESTVPDSPDSRQKPDKSYLYSLTYHPWDHGIRKKRVILQLAASVVEQHVPLMWSI